MDGDLSNAEVSQPKIDVQLHWRDFVYSLEEARHQQGPNTDHRNWFKLNPFEIVALGCDTVIKNGFSIQRMNTIMVGMENITPHLHKAPRMFSWIIELLLKIMTNQTCSAHNWQKCWKLVNEIQHKIKDNLRFYTYVIQKMAENIDILGQQSFSQPTEIRSSVQFSVSEFKQLEMHAMETCKNFDPGFKTENHLAIQIHLLIKQYGFAQVNLLWKELSIAKTVQDLLTSESNKQQFLFELLRFVQIFLESLSINDKETTEEGPTSDRCQQLEIVKDIFSEATDVINKWLAYFCGVSEIPSKIVSAFSTILCARGMSVEKNDWSSRAAWLSRTMDALLEYAVEGGKRKGFAADILVHELEFLISSCECDVPYSKALLIHLPNLLRPVFGFNDWRIICKALEYGSLAFRSKYEKQLLGEGLWFIHKTHSLFISQEQVRQQIAKCHQRIDAVTTAMAVVEGILHQVWQPKLASNSIEDTHFHGTAEFAESTDENGIGGNILVYRQEQEMNAPDGNREKSAVTSSNEYEVDDASKGDQNRDDDVLQGLDSNDTSQCAGEEQQSTTCLTSQFLGEEAEDHCNAKASFEDETSEILFLMYCLACSVIKNGENTCYTFASVIPKLFTPTYMPEIPKDLPADYFKGYHTGASQINWKIVKNKLAIKVLELCIKCTEFRSSTAFQICSVMIPKLVSNLDRTELNDNQKLDALLEFIDTCQPKAHIREDVNALIGNGLDLISLLMPKGLDITGLQNFLPSALKSLDKILKSTSLLFLRNSCHFFMSSFPDENERLKGLFFKILEKGRKNDIRNIHLLSAEWMKDERFNFLLQTLYDYGNGILKAKQLQSICEILTCIVAIERKLLTACEEPLDADDQSECTRSNIQKLTKPFVDEIKDLLEKRGFSEKMQKHLMEKVSYLNLYSTLYSDELLEQIKRCTDNETIKIDARIPKDVSEDSELMELVQTSARRIEHMQLPRFHSLKMVLTSILREFLKYRCTGLNDSQSAERSGTWHIHDEERKKQECSPRQDQNPLMNRKSELNSYLHSLPANAKILERIKSYGYQPIKYEEKVEIVVRTNGSLNVEENLRQTLLASFLGYIELLKQLGVPVIQINDKDVKLDDIFTDELTLTDMKGRRAIIVKVIDKEASRIKRSDILERKLLLLSDEERIETEMEIKASAKLRPKSFRARLNTSFFDCAACCGPQIIGCYAPNSDHCERPLEIGMRCDSGFISIYDDTDTEIENAEVLFMDQGVYVFRTYSNGHPYDTSQVWTDFFDTLLEKNLFPAILLSQHMPNRHTWEKIRRTAPTALTGMMLSCDFDFSSEWRSYYDARPQSIRCGKDIVLVKGFKSKHNRPGFQRQFSMPVSKDLAGLIFDSAMQEILTDEVLKEFRFLGGAIAEYISDLIETGVETPEIITKQFCYDRWLQKNKSKQTDVSTKTEILDMIFNKTSEAVKRFISEINLNQLFKKRRRHFFQLKKFLEKRRAIKRQEFTRNFEQEIRCLLKRKVKIIHIDTLPQNLQEEVMHWIFGNEDRVWRYRGGRDGYETIQQYLRFLYHVRNENAEKIVSAFPGVVALVSNSGKFSADGFQIKDIAGYAVGEYVEEPESLEKRSPEEEKDEETEKGEGDEAKNWSGKYFEIVTAWVSPEYRKLNLSTDLYLEIISNVEVPHVAFDVIKGSLEKVIGSSPTLRLLGAVCPLSFVIKTQKASYSVATSSFEENFEKIVISRRPVHVALSLFKLLKLFYEYAFLFLLPFIIGVISLLYSFVFQTNSR